jgi:ATP synthase F1 gamma subunit
MPVLDDLRNDLSEITTLKFISAAFAESAAARIGKIRDAFEKNQAYFQEISGLYHLVKVSAGVEEKLAQKKAEHPKTVCVALTSNHRFYGLLNMNTMETFVSQSESMTTDRIVIGQTGEDYVKMLRYSHPYSAVIFQRDYPTDDELSTVLASLAPYNQVFLMYPKFQTMLRQTVEMVDITETPSHEELAKEDMVHEIFEPQLSKILAFFDRQVRGLLFKRAILEAELSRTAARLLAMSAAEERADKLTKEKRMQIGKVKSTILNTQLMETFTGIKLWKKT